MTASIKTRSPKADASRLDRRREKLQARRLEADAALHTLATHAEAIASNSTQLTQLEADIATTRDRLAVLKKSLENARNERNKLRNGRKKVRQNSAKTALRANNAERKYDRSMLADMLEREKQLDLSRHSAPTAAADITATVEASTPAARVTAEKAPATVSKPAESPMHEAPSALTPPPAATTAARQTTAQTRAPRRATTQASRTASSRTASSRSGGGARGTSG